MLHARVVLVAVAAGGVGLAFAAIALARGAEALGGVGEGKGYEERKRSGGGDEASPERGADGPGDLRTKKATSSGARGGVARRNGWRERDALAR